MRMEEKCYGMNEVLSRIWKLFVETSLTLSAFCGRLMEEYSLSWEECAEDVLEGVEALRKQKLIEVL